MADLASTRTLLLALWYSYIMHGYSTPLHVPGPFAVAVFAVMPLALSLVPDSEARTGGAGPPEAGEGKEAAAAAAAAAAAPVRSPLGSVSPGCSSALPRESDSGLPGSFETAEPTERFAGHWVTGRRHREIAAAAALVASVAAEVRQLAAAAAAVPALLAPPTVFVVLCYWVRSKNRGLDFKEKKSSHYFFLGF